MSAALITGLGFGLLVAAQIGPISLLLNSALSFARAGHCRDRDRRRAAVVDTGYARSGSRAPAASSPTAAFDQCSASWERSSSPARVPDALVGTSRARGWRDRCRGAKPAAGLPDVGGRLEPDDHRLLGGDRVASAAGVARSPSEAASMLAGVGVGSLARFVVLSAVWRWPAGMWYAARAHRRRGGRCRPRHLLGRLAYRAGTEYALKRRAYRCLADRRGLSRAPRASA